MAKPMGVVTKSKDNSRKNHRSAEDFAKGKKLGRPKQIWIIDNAAGDGHWEKVK